ncbi:Mediator of RNA polymerase II transcription subunit 4 [Fulvia fulva]|uniref:Mediator of RNA polymerase II transcription subunit 4 n=1 Tax=Passalora fulva TaxID=5499 RepID=A0A9Q8PFV2_PASFU|nr:Mediator of RNA polymerase II transcription subunit 4 [Fulvia fulva]KAK4613709.1 Mediator of RNA polymerase II transcription subunit 4 [Fulvia fulva]KAK4614793.1 Mediator of RNA polymerase II transcription subunit 4 [Fulvia fulva]UJO21650.1 Mediator of RNA polymerase II transcription subunit 4 [Fulvia fulva]WPV20570.1 Mediator of RNA polymerase II transcription subunit 4 [Fulvia fulva]WPV35080.1 Mediator of RNA polymerase II transcription subunit 4 [Fulvia fulva]
MDAEFQTTFQRVETALQRLTDSIAAYNPSTTAAEELVEADAVVAEQVAKLVKHQQNYRRIQELRETADSLDETIKNTIRVLADTRKEIQSIPTSETTEPRREVRVDELLAYAKFIAPTTVPPTVAKSFVPIPEDKKDTEAQTTNGIATPPQVISQDVDNPAYVKSEGREKGIEQMAQADKNWLQPVNFAFDFWPTPDQMKHGALGRIQYMIEQGKDPASVLSAEDQAKVDKERKEREDRERAEEEARERRNREEWGHAAPNRRGTVVEPFNPDDL